MQMKEIANKLIVCNIHRFLQFFFVKIFYRAVFLKFFLTKKNYRVFNRAYYFCMAPRFACSTVFAYRANTPDNSFLGAVH